MSRRYVSATERPRRDSHDAIYTARLAWKFGGQALNADATCCVCGAPFAEHGRYNLICLSANRLDDIPEVPAALDALTFRPLLYVPQARTVSEPDPLERRRQQTHDVSTPIRRRKAVAA